MCTPRLIATIILIILTGGLALVFITWRKENKEINKKII